MAITPTPEQFSAFAHGTREGEVVMINLLHFSAPDEPDASSDADASGASGRDAYRQYGDEAVRWSSPAAAVCCGWVVPSTC